MSESPRQYSDVERERAYVAYRDESGRRLRKTAEATGIPFGTIATWSREDGWQLRLRADDDRAISAMRRHTELAMLGKLDLAVEGIWEIAESDVTDSATVAANKVRLDAYKYLVGSLGYSPQAAATLAAKGHDYQLGADTLPATSATPKTTAELRAIVAGESAGQEA